MNFLLIFYLLFFLSTSYAEDWSFNFNVNQELSYDDNVTMTKDPQESIEYKLVSNLTFLYRTDIVELQADTSYGVQNYTNIDGLDFSLQEYILKGTYFTEKSNFGLLANYSILPSRNTAEEDSGNFNSTSDKEIKTIAPFISYELTELDHISIEALYTENTFSEGEFGDNTHKKIDLTWQHQWTQRYKTTISLFFSQFEFMGGSSNTNTTSKTSSDNYGINFSSAFLISDKWTVISRIGYRITETTENLINEQINLNSTGFLTNTSINYDGEYFFSGLAITRSLIPSNQGQLDEQSKLSLSLGYHLTERLTTLFSAKYQISEKEGDNSGDNESKRENIIFESSINWEMLQHLMLSVSYRYRFQDTSDEDFSVDSNLFMFHINYDWPGQIELK